MRRFLFLLCLALPAYAVDEKPPRVEDVPSQLEDAPEEVPEPPMPVQSGETLEPDITIIRKGKNTIQEYRHGAQLYMIKVIPDVGPPYYFIDSDGDGRMDVQGNDGDRGSQINMWKILEWD